jgi:hypothetical protein
MKTNRWYSFTLFIFFTFVFFYITSKIVFSEKIFSNKFYLIFLLINSIILFIIYYSFKITKSNYTNFKLLTISLILSLYTIEISYKSAQNYLAGFEKKNKDALENIYLDKLKNKENVTLQLSPGMFLDYSDQQNNNFLPLSGISNTQTLMCNESKNLIQYQTDRYGFNNNNAIWDEKIIDILLIGDSFTHGLCVNNEFNIKGNLELLGGGQRLTKT